MSCPQDKDDAMQFKLSDYPVETVDRVFINDCAAPVSLAKYPSVTTERHNAPETKKGGQGLPHPPQSRCVNPAPSGRG